MYSSQISLRARDFKVADLFFWVSNLVVAHCSVFSLFVTKTDLHICLMWFQWAKKECLSFDDLSFRDYQIFHHFIYDQRGFQARLRILDFSRYFKPWHVKATINLTFARFTKRILAKKVITQIQFTISLSQWTICPLSYLIQTLSIHINNFGNTRWTNSPKYNFLHWNKMS